MEGTGEAVPMSIPASVKGWDQISSLASMEPDHAIQLDNWIPRPGYLEIRRGSNVWATGLGGGSNAVESILIYNAQNSNNGKMFGVANGTIYDATTQGAASATSITGLANSRLQYTLFTNAASTTFLMAANGADTPVIYDGSTWASMTLTGITPSTVNSFYAWMGRVWMTFNNSTKVGYLPIGAITGAVTTFDMGQNMTRGGSVIAIASWTQDSKQNVDEYIVFITSRGQVMVYSGTDPATAPTFQLVGIYNLGPPIGGPRCFMRIAGNLWIISVDGITPLSEMMTLDRAAVAKVAPTTMIQNAMLMSTRNYGANFGWQLIEYPKGQLAILNIPQIENKTIVQYVMNTLTGAWCQFVNINACTWAVLNNIPYFGAADSKIYQWDIGSGDEVGDENHPIVATVQTAFNYFKSRGHLKQWTMVRPIITTDGSVVPAVGLNIDFGTGAPLSIPTTQSFASLAKWDVSKWDQVNWPANSATVATWTTVDGIGQCASIITQASTSDNGTTNGVTLQLNSWDLIAKQGKAFF
jgi:hypothetical protein